MFLPNDMTEAERIEARTVRDQLLARLPSTATEDDRRAAELRAAEIAGEQIWADRRSSRVSTSEPEPPAADTSDAELVMQIHREMNEELQGHLPPEIP